MRIVFITDQSYNARRNLQNNIEKVIMKSGDTMTRFEICYPRLSADGISKLFRGIHYADYVIIDECVNKYENIMCLVNQVIKDYFWLKGTLSFDDSFFKLYSTLSSKIGDVDVEQIY